MNNINPFGNNTNGIKRVTGAGGSNANRHRMICVDCKKRYDHARYNKIKGYFPTGRFTLPRHPDKYKRPVKCPKPRCKSENVRSMEESRRKEVAKQNTCRCQPIPFPHKKGSILGCEFHPKDFDDWTQDDYDEYQGMLATPRTEEG